MKYSKCVSYTPSLLWYSNNYNFLSSMISANHNKRERFYPIVNHLYPVLFLYCRISFIKIFIYIEQHYFHSFVLKPVMFFNYSFSKNRKLKKKGCFECIRFLFPDLEKKTCYVRLTI